MGEDYMMPTSLTLETARNRDGKLVLTAAGEIDLSNIDAFEQALATATTEAADSGETVTVDLGAVEYLDSAAINALFTYADHIHLIAHPVLMPVFGISGLSELVTIESVLPEQTDAEPD